MEQGYETFFYETKDEGRKKFVVVKFNPGVYEQAGMKMVTSGCFQFIITDENKYNEIMDEIEKILSKLPRRGRSRRKRSRIISQIDNLLAEALIDGITFEISVERGLYLSKLIEKLTDEDFDIQREIRNNIMFEEKYRSKDRDMSVL